MVMVVTSLNPPWSTTFKVKLMARSNGSADVSESAPLAVSSTTTAASYWSTPTLQGAISAGAPAIVATTVSVVPPPDTVPVRPAASRDRSSKAWLMTRNAGVGSRSCAETPSPSAPRAVTGAPVAYLQAVRMARAAQHQDLSRNTVVARPG